MKKPSPLTVKIVGIILPLMLITLLAIQSSCSSTGRIGKEKRGMVPCPCEKRNNRR